MGNAAGTVDAKASKMEIYRALKSEIGQIQNRLEAEGKKESLSEEEFSQLAGEELATSLGVSEELIQAIAHSAGSPSKSKGQGSAAVQFTAISSAVEQPKPDDEATPPVPATPASTPAPPPAIPPC